MDKFYKYDYDDTTRGVVATAADPSEIQEGGEKQSRLLVGGKGGGEGGEGDNPD
jgi:hypothetical protein